MSRVDRSIKLFLVFETVSKVALSICNGLKLPQFSCLAQHSRLSEAGHLLDMQFVRLMEYYGNYSFSNSLWFHPPYIRAGDFWGDFCLRLYHWLWPKPWLHTNSLVPTTLFSNMDCLKWTYLPKCCCFTTFLGQEYTEILSTIECLLSYSLLFSFIDLVWPSLLKKPKGEQYLDIF